MSIKISQDLLDLLYPIGRILETTNSSDNPNNLYNNDNCKSTWVQYGVGKVLVGLDTTQTEFNTVGQVGGEKTHTLTIAEMPSHTHIQDAHSHEVTNCTTSYGAGSQSSWRSLSWSGTNHDFWNDVWSWSTTATNQYTGGSGAHNNMPPYVVIYRWRRTS